MNQKLLWHLLAVGVVAVWGTTFVNTKILYNSGLTPSEIFFLRFLIAYVAIWFISPRKLFANSWRDEGTMLLLGITGGSLFFVAENSAVALTYVNNVSFITSTSPLVTVILGIVFVKSIKATWTLIVGSLIALVGVGLVIFNGSFILHLNPWGDLLALLTAVCWAVYTLLMKSVSERYSAVFITRKLFFYGLLTVLPMFLIDPWTVSLATLLTPKVAFNLLLLGLVASFLCFALWTVVIERLGVMTASNYQYLNPITTVVASAIWLSEPMTAIAYIGSALILIGVIVSNK
ncbi:MAG: DMT family transporter [Prevotella sp.]|jgi:integral membrane protein|uniref:DMT family transporter n=1 Tax=Prevotella sp. oral taxon 306 TaxID=712461 RepID=UPI00025BB741|nr:MULTISPECIES: DMT family transporter [unclassified Prevotella]EID33429.1 EamA-like transporter family protein [Prevotella sp. oral taxon 306 str. F0472]MBF1627378.1 DMT family transporter [Prevotella sp.]MBF1630323.1 DMT family transporter [Prevotella sp.]